LLSNYIGDGIFDQISNEEISEAVWMTQERMTTQSNIHTQAGMGLDMIMKTALARRSLDNITCVFIGFENWEKVIEKRVSLLSCIKIDSRKESNEDKEKKKRTSNSNAYVSNDIYSYSNAKSKSNYGGFRSASSGKKLKDIY
jgi:serine/threonine protein phosphatase PrpC